jgi:hypothetical protein
MRQSLQCEDLCETAAEKGLAAQVGPDGASGAVTVISNGRALGSLPFGFDINLKNLSRA